jgi:predicted DNA-binding transcriptional regulator AlpA
MQNNTPAPDRFLGSAEAAAFFNYSLPHFRFLVKTGRLPAPVRISGRKLAWRQSLLSDFAAAVEAEQQVRPTAA